MYLDYIFNKVYFFSFRVCAKNASGNSEYSEASEAMIPEDILILPTFALEADMQRNITVSAGGSIRLFVGIKGRPTPTATWVKENGIPTDRGSVENMPNYSLLTVRNCDRSDAGKYELLLENTSGSKSLFLNVKILDSPGVVSNLQVNDITKSTVFLTWEPPKQDGGSNVTRYTVDQRLATNKSWITVSSEVTRESVKVLGLKLGEEYYFRIMAENKFGLGRPSELPKAIKICEVWKIHQSFFIIN